MTKPALHCWLLGMLICCGTSGLTPDRAGAASTMEEYIERLAAVETELANLKHGTGGGSCGGCDDGCNSCCCRTFYSGFEVPFLKVHNSGLVIPAVGFTTPDFDYQPGFRAWGGTEWSDGLGARLTYFDFEDASTSVIAGVPLGAGFDIYAFDLELTQRGMFYSWDFLLSGGVRFAGLEQNLGVGALGGVGALLDFDGAGLTLGLAFDRPVADTALSFFGSLRGSLLYGTADVNGTLLGVPFAAQLPSETISVLEMQMGMEFRREVGNGVGFVRGALEGQLWEQPPLLLGIGDANIGLFGPTMAVGFEM